MSFENWNVNDPCKALTDMEVELDILDSSGSFVEQVTIEAGTPGVVRVIDRDTQALHVSFEKSTGTARLVGDQLANLGRG